MKWNEMKIIYFKLIQPTNSFYMIYNKNEEVVEEVIV